MEIHRISSFNEFVTEHFPPMTTHVEDAWLHRIFLKQKSSPSQSIKIIKKKLTISLIIMLNCEKYLRGVAWMGNHPIGLGKGVVKRIMER